MKGQKGITLVSLIVTIIVLIVLSTVSIGAVFGENGILKQVEESKEMRENEIKVEEGSLNQVLDIYANAMATSIIPQDN